MNYYYLLVILLLVLLFVYCQIRVHRKQNTDYQILQVSDPEKNILEETLNQKYPTVSRTNLKTRKNSEQK